MSELKTALIKRFGERRVSDYPTNSDDYINLLKIEIEANIPLTVILTNGMSDYEMPVPESCKGKEFNEIYFCLPSYWDLNDKENPNVNWPLKMIQKLARNVIENKTWYGPGHTIANGNPSTAISETMLQDHFLLATPIALEDYLQPIEIDNKIIRFLAIVPVFHQEFEQKMSKGYSKWIIKYRSRNGNEILDDFRQSIHKSRWWFR